MPIELDALSKAAIKTVGGKSNAKQAAEHGADAGWPGFTSYTDTIKFYTKNKKLIMQALREDADNFGVTVSEMTKAWRALKGVPDAMTVLAEGDSHEDFTTVANAMAWYALERAGQSLLN
jgi:hypothetical protein